MECKNCGHEIERQGNNWEHKKYIYLVKKDLIACRFDFCWADTQEQQVCGCTKPEGEIEWKQK